VFRSQPVAQFMIDPWSTDRPQTAIASTGRARPAGGGSEGDAAAAAAQVSPGSPTAAVVVGETAAAIAGSAAPSGAPGGCASCPLVDGEDGEPLGVSSG
jgi:hypothetical protein